MHGRLHRSSYKILPLLTFIIVCFILIFSYLPDLSSDSSNRVHREKSVERQHQNSHSKSNDRHSKQHEETFSNVDSDLPVRSEKDTGQSNEDNSGIPNMSLSQYNKFLTTQMLLGTKYPKRVDIIKDQSTKEKALARCYHNFWHTLTSTTKRIPGDTGGLFVFTGDIPEMWVRDSAAQVHGYIPLARYDTGLRNLISDLINRTAYYITIDPYANSFSHVKKNFTDAYNLGLGRYGFVTTFNYELDSGCYFFRLLYTYWKSVGNVRIFKSKHVQAAVARMIEVWGVEQYHHENRSISNYRNPATGKSLYRYPELQNDMGTPVNYTGMTWTGFRPSDDACTYGYLVPANMFASATLKYVIEMARELWHNKDLASAAAKLKLEIDTGIEKFAIVKHEKYGKIYAYEVDGLGNSNLMDDANVPSLISIPYLGYDYDPEIYANTRKFILSPDNPYYKSSNDGKYKGIGSFHNRGAIPNNVWPMAQIMQGLTSDNDEEKLNLLNQLLTSDAGTNWTHESYDVDNPRRFTRHWFCWADALFAEFVQSITSGDCIGTRPDVRGLQLEKK